MSDTMKNVFPTSYVSVDTETTGLFPKYGDKIIQLSAVKYIDDKQTETFNKYINPDGTENFAKSINGIQDASLAKEPSINEVLPSFISFVGDLPWLGHNLNFDFRFLENEGLNVEQYRKNYVDTLSLARRTFGNKHNKLWRLEKRFDIVNDHQHLSLSDAFATAEVYQKLREIVPPLAVKRYNKKTKKHIPAASQDNSLSGLRIVFTGRFQNGTRDDLQNFVERHGGKSPESVSKATDFLVVGKQTSKTKYNGHSDKEMRAMKYGTNIISINDLLKMASTGEK